MKKLMLMMAALVMFALSSCGGGGADPAQVNEKIAAGDTLSQDDYKCMIQYINKALGETQSQLKGVESFTDCISIFAKIDKMYPYAETFDNYLEAHYLDLDPQNVKAYNEMTTLARKVNDMVPPPPPLELVNAVEVEMTEGEAPADSTEAARE